MNHNHNKWKCKACDCWTGSSTELLSAPHPFADGATVYGCPVCKDVTEVVAACDEPGCSNDVVCGTPMKNGDYRVTCFRHIPKQEAA